MKTVIILFSFVIFLFVFIPVVSLTVNLTSFIWEFLRKTEIARNFKQKGVSDDVIAECTGLPVAVITEL